MLSATVPGSVEGDDWPAEKGASGGVIVFPADFPTYAEGPRVSQFTASDGEQTGNLSIFFRPDRLSVTFSEAPNTDGTGGAHSVLNRGNWRLLAGSVDVSELIVGIDAVDREVTFTLSQPLAPGKYRLVASEAIQSVDGIGLNGGDVFEPGGDWTGTITVAPVFDKYEQKMLEIEAVSPVIAADADGNYVFVWRSLVSPAMAPKFVSSWIILAQRFNAEGEAQGDIIEVSTEASLQTVSVAMNADGAFVVVWESSGESDHYEPHLFARQFAADGTPVGDEYRVSGITGATQSHASVAIDSAGGFTVLWQEQTAGTSLFTQWVRRFDVNGAPQSEPILVAQGLYGSLAGDSHGNFVAVWHGIQSESGQLFAQRFSKTGEALGDRIRVASRVQSGSGTVAMDESGNFVVVWRHSENRRGTLLAQRFNSAGQFVGQAVPVDDDVDFPGPDYEGGSSAPQVALDAAGRLTVAWAFQTHEIGTPSNWLGPRHLLVRLFNGNNDPIGSSFQVAFDIVTTSIASSAAGELIVSWVQSSPFATTFTSVAGAATSDFVVLEPGIFVRHFILPGALAVDLNGDAPGIDYAVNYQPGGSAITIVDGQLRIHDATQLVSARVAIDGALAGDVLGANTQGTDIAADYDSGVLTLSGTDSVANYEKVLRTVTFHTTADRPAGSHVEVSFTVNDGESDSAAAITTISVYEPGLASIVGRHVFYNNSAFDGRDGTINAADDGAIATDKIPLLSGGTATFANLTSYTRGVNGIMIDLAGTHGQISTGDFAFHVGNSGNTENWRFAVDPSSIVVRPGAGVGGSDRIEIIWPDGAIRNTWLEVIVLANGNTGLAAADTFYFANVVGETGNASFGSVRPSDVQQIVNQLLGSGSSQPAAIENPYDFNRDGVVSTRDVLSAVNQVLASQPPLEQISNLAPTLPPTFVPQPIIVDSNVPIVIIPRTSTETLIAGPAELARIEVDADHADAAPATVAAVLGMWETDELDSLADDPYELLLPTEARP